MPDFNEVGAAIMSERRYQDSKWTDLDKKNNPDDFIGYIQKYVEAFKTCESLEEKLNNARKVTALGVVMMEKFGAPQREGFECGPFNDKGCSGDKACPECPMDENCHLTLAGDPPDELSDDELTKVIADEQEAVKVERGVYYRVKEVTRVYIFDQPDATHEFTDVRAFAVMPSGGHRLLDKYGTWYYVQPGWRVLIVPKAEVV